MADSKQTAKFNNRLPQNTASSMSQYSDAGASVNLASIYVPEIQVLRLMTLTSETSSLLIQDAATPLIIPRWLRGLIT